MPRQCKLRLGDGTILAVAPEGLSTWLIDEKAMVQVAGSRRWRPLKDVLAEARLAAAQRAAYTPPPPKPDDGSPPVPLRSAEEVLAEARAAVAQRSAAAAPPPPKAKADDDMPVIPFKPIEAAESEWPAVIASPLAAAVSAPAIPIKLDEPAAEWSAPILSEPDLPASPAAAALDDEPIIAFKPIEDPEPVWTEPEPEPEPEPAAELAEPPPLPVPAAPPPVLAALEPSPMPAALEPSPIVAELDEPPLPPDLFRDDTPIIPLKPAEFEVDWPVPAAPAPPRVEPPPPPAKAPPPPPYEHAHELDPSLEQEILDELDELDLIEDEPPPVIPARAPEPPPRPTVPVPEPPAVARPSPPPAPVAAKPAPPSPPPVRNSAAFAPTRPPQPPPEGGFVGWIKRILRRDRPALSLFSHEAPTSWAPSAPAPVRREAVKPPPTLEQLPSLRLAPVEKEHAGDLYGEDHHAPRVSLARWAMIAGAVVAGLAVVFTYPWWLPRLTQLGQGDSAPSGTAAGGAPGPSLPGGPAVPVSFSKEILQAAERMPHLAPATIHLLAASGEAQTLVVPEVFRRAHDASRRGRRTLPPAELKELGALEAAVLSSLRPAERDRVRAYDRISGSDLLSAEDERVLSLFARGARNLPPQRRERLQTLSGKAIAAVLAPAQR
jgi:hypothetical protein